MVLEGEQDFQGFSCKVKLRVGDVCYQNIWKALQGAVILHTRIRIIEKYLINHTKIFSPNWLFFTIYDLPLHLTVYLHWTNLLSLLDSSTNGGCTSGSKIQIVLLKGKVRNYWGIYWNIYLLSCDLFLVLLFLHHVLAQCLGHKSHH